MSEAAAPDTTGPTADAHHTAPPPAPTSTPAAQSGPSSSSPTPLGDRRPATSTPTRIPAQPGKALPGGVGGVEAVRVHEAGAMLLADGWSTGDPDVVAAARASLAHGDRLDAWLEATLRLGVVASHAVGGSLLRDDGRAVVDGVQQAVRSLTESVQQQVRGSMDLLESRVAQTVDPESGPLARSVQQGCDRIATGVGRLFVGPEAEVPARIRATTDRVLSERLGVALEGINHALGQHSAGLRALSEQDRTQLVTSLVAVVERQDRELRDGLQEIQRSLHQRNLDEATTTATAQAEATAGSHKGATYEDALAAAVSRISHAAGDGPSDAVGTTAGPNGSRAGDVVTTLTSLGDPAKLLVWECKVRGRKLAASAWVAELARARLTRAGQGPAIAIGVAPTDQLPGAGTAGPIVMLSPSSFLVGWEPDDHPALLTAVYHVARLAAATTTVSNTPGVNLAAMERGLRDLLPRLQPLQVISGESAKCQRSAAKVADLAQTLLTDLERDITALQRRLTTTPTP